MSKRIKRSYKKRVSIDETTFEVLEAAITVTGHTLASFATMAIEEKLLRLGYGRQYDSDACTWIWYEVEHKQG